MKKYQISVAADEQLVEFLLAKIERLEELVRGYEASITDYSTDSKPYSMAGGAYERTVLELCCHAEAKRKDGGYHVIVGSDQENNRFKFSYFLTPNMLMYDSLIVSMLSDMHKKLIETLLKKLGIYKSECNLYENNPKNLKVENNG